MSEKLTKHHISNPNPPHINNKVRIYILACEGWYPSKIAKHLNISSTAVRKQLKKYVAEGKIERTNRTPALYRKKQCEPPPYIPSSQCEPFLPKKPIFLPHHLGAIFSYFGTLSIRRNSKNMFYVKEPNYTIIIGRTKIVIWLKAFIGTSVNEILENAQRDIDAIAISFQKKHNINMVLQKMYNNVEWVLTDEPAGKTTNEKCNIAPERKIGQALFKFDDATHPQKIEINKAKNEPETIPTDYAKTLEYLLVYFPFQQKALYETITDIQTRLQRKGI